MQASITNDKKPSKKELKEKAKFRNKRLFQYALKLKPLIIFGIVLTFVSALAELAGPYIISLILDVQLKEGVGATNTFNFRGLVILYFISTLVVAGLRYTMNITFSRIANQMGLIIRKDVFSHVVSLPVSFFDKYPVGKIVTRITNDTQDVRLLIQILFFDIISTAIFAFGILVSLFVVNPFLGFITILALPIIYIVFIDYKNKSTRYNTDMRRYNSEMNANINESIQNMEIVQAFNKEEAVYEEYSDLNDSHFGEGRKMSTLWSYSSYNATNTLSNLAISIALYYFASSFLNNTAAISVGALYVFIDYNKKLYQYINNLTNRIGELEKAKSAADQVFELLEVDEYKNGSEIIPNMRGEIEFKDVNFAYNKGEYVLNNININLKPGESAAFVGHTGSGKSTIMNLIYNFYKVEEGNILLDGIDINSVDMEEARKQMAIVFQNPYIFEGTIYDNISLFDESISKNEAELALINVGGERILQRKEGIDGRVQESGGGFSAGEKQLISFARAMVRNPKILVLDEATANVDSETEEYIQFGVNRLKKGRTTLIIAHRLSTIKEVEKIFVLDKGRIIEQGNHQTLLDLNGVYAQMYRNS